MTNLGESILDPTEDVAVPPEAAPRKRSKKKSVRPKMQGAKYCGEFKETCLRIYDSLPIERRDSQRELLASMAEAMELGYAKQERNRRDEEDGIEVDKDLKGAEYFIGQAPVGTGKTYVLLLLAFVAFWLYGKRTVISTQTKVLQNQLLKKDIPVFKKLLGEISGTKGIVDDTVLIQWTAHLVKGRDNYLCPNMVSKYMDDARDGKDMIATDSRGKEIVISYSQLIAINGGDSAFGDGRMESLDLDRYSQIGNWNEDILTLVSACAENCDSENCPYFPKKCAYYNAKFQNSPLIVCNHNIIKSLLRPDLHPKEEASIEADTNAADEKPEGQQTEEVIDIGLIDPVETEAPVDIKDAPKEKAVSPLSTADNYFFDEAHHFMGYYCGKGTEQELSSGKVYSLIFAPIFCFVNDRLKRELLDIKAKRNDIWAEWKILCRVGTTLDTKETENPAVRFKQFNSQIDKLLTMCDELKDLYNVFSASKTRIGLYKLEILKRGLLEMQTDLKETSPEEYIGTKGSAGANEEGKKIFIHTLEGYESAVFKASNLSDDLETNFQNAAFAGFISGTLLVDGKDDVFRAECGLPKCHVVEVASPFEHKNITLWVPKADAKLPYPINQRGKSPEEQIEWKRWAEINKEKRNTFLVNFCKALIPKYVQKDMGGVLVLCTSNETKELIAKSIRSEIEAIPDRFVFEQGEMPRVRLVKNFMNCHSPVLVATNSFREGFDAVENNLTWVILDRLPYSNPVDRELQERLDILLQNHKIKDKRDHVSTLMFFSLIQSLGRLERTVRDWGMMTILDPRFYWLCQEGIDDRLAIFSDEFRKDIELAFKTKKNKPQEQMPEEYEWLPKKEYFFQKNVGRKQQKKRLDMTAFMSAIGAVNNPQEEQIRIEAEIEKDKRERLLKRQLEIPYFWDNMSNFIKNKPSFDEIYRITQNVRKDARRAAYIESHRHSPSLLFEPIKEDAEATCA